MEEAQKLTKEEVAFVIETSANLSRELEEIKAQHAQISAIFSGVIDLLPTAIWLLNADGSIYLQNSRSLEIDLDLSGLDLQTSETEIEIKDKNYILQIENINGKTIVAATDNTKIKRNERLVSMGKMAAHLAHEIRNPIGSVSILISTIFGRVGIMEKPIILEIKKAIWRIERIVKATLLFSKGVTLNPKRFYFEELIEELNATTANYSYSKEIDFRYKFLPEIIEADFDLLGMVFQNLIVNAIDAIEESDDESGVITVLHSKSSTCHELKVLDSGKDFENKELIFEAFRTTKTKGHGLGLALTKQIIEAHKGSITLCKDEKGFLIHLPAV
ncbi:MAG: sensor histidine kinase [Helicobacteraceae bacterium]